MRSTGKRRRWWWWKWGNGVALTEMTFSIKLTKPVSLLLSHSLPILLFEPCVRVLTHHRADEHFAFACTWPAGAPRTCGKLLLLMRSPGTRAAAEMPACDARCVHWCSETRGAKAADGAAAATSAAAKTGECILQSRRPFFEFSRFDTRFVTVCVSLFYVIDTGSIRPRARILGGPPSPALGGLQIP